MDQAIKPSSLVRGADLISRYLRLCLVPNGFIYKFDSAPGHRPKPLSLAATVLCFSPLMALGLIQLIVKKILSGVNSESSEYKSIMASVFILRLVRMLRLYRVVVVVVNLFITLNQHGRISSVIATGNHYLSQREMSRFAKSTFSFFCFNVLANTLAYSTVIAHVASDQFDNRPLFYAALICLSLFLFWVRLANCATLVYTCYLGSALGRHVENFSTIYIDSMFDQFMRAVEKDDARHSETGSSDNSGNSNQTRRLLFAVDGQVESASVGSIKLDQPETKRRLCSQLWRLPIELVASICRLVRWAIFRLAEGRYPELPEMKMTKLSSTSEIQMSESTRRTNNYLIRARLRRTQQMIGNLRDLVSDVNKTSSPIILIFLLFETIFLILITTASVQAKVYKSFNVLILPTISVTISVASSVVYVCIYSDESAKQLKLLINKLFDFIIMNHRVKSSGKRTGRLRPGVDYEADEACPLPGSELGAINETWSQFQYTRKLANTIQFTMGGIFPITRRLVLSVLGHILSAVFISIEIMSIIDTMNMPAHRPASPHNRTDRHHAHHLIRARSLPD